MVETEQAINRLAISLETAGQFRARGTGLPQRVIEHRLERRHERQRHDGAARIGGSTGISAPSAIRPANASSIASAARRRASASSLPKVVTSGRAGQVTSKVSLSSGSSLIHSAASLQSQVLEDLVDQSFAELLAAAVHGKLAFSVAAADREVPADALVRLESAAVRGEEPFELLRFHQYRIVHTSVEVNRSVEFGGEGIRSCTLPEQKKSSGPRARRWSPAARYRASP